MTASNKLPKSLSNGCNRDARASREVKKKGIDMNLTVVHIGPLVALVAGILILIMPRLLNYIIALYLIIIGLVGLFGTRI
jgi:hypothetical protein